MSLLSRLEPLLPRQRRARRARRQITDTVLGLFPNQPYCLGGTWSWAGEPLDLVFPDLQLSAKNGRTISTALVVHCCRPGKEIESTRLYEKARELEVPLLLLKDGETPDRARLAEMIASVFRGQVKVFPE